jgi:Polyketide cyclase / dehydrase and lipid transport
MQGKLQGQNEIVVYASPDRIWEILEDSESNLPRVLPMVTTCEIQSGGRERIGAVRTCDVDFGGKTGKTVERCIERVPHRRLAHRIEDDSFGFSRRLSDFWFSFTLEPVSAGTTLVRLETHYDPRGILGRLMSALMAKRQFGRVRESALENLKRLAESGATVAA